MQQVEFLVNTTNETELLINFNFLQPEIQYPSERIITSNNQIRLQPKNQVVYENHVGNNLISYSC